MISQDLEPHQSLFGLTENTDELFRADDSHALRRVITSRFTDIPYHAKVLTVHAIRDIIDPVSYVSHVMFYLKRDIDRIDTSKHIVNEMIFHIKDCESGSFQEWTSSLTNTALRHANMIVLECIRDNPETHHFFVDVIKSLSAEHSIVKLLTRFRPMEPAIQFINEITPLSSDEISQLEGFKRTNSHFVS